jgi:hypothetical protein
MAEPQLENQRLDRTRTWIRKVYRDTLITETITTFIMLCWKYDNSELAIYVLLSFLNCICIRTWDGDTKYKVMGLIGIVIQVYGSSRVFDTKEWNILSLFCLILVMFNFWIPVCRFGHGGGLGSAAKSHSETAHKQNTVDAHRKAARANVAVARTALKRGDVQKAKEHLEAAKVHQNKVKGFKMEQPVTAPLKKLEKVSDWKKVGGDKQAKEWTQKLDPDEISALKIYTGEAYASINKDLRNHKGKIVDEENDPHFLTVMNIDAALQRGRTGRAMVVSRQLSGDVPGLEKGAIFRDHGYMSTSVGGKFDAPTGKTQVQMNILVPKGSKGGFLSMSKYPDEKEFLLPRGSRLKIVDSKTKDGVKHVYAHLIQD